MAICYASARLGFPFQSSPQKTSFSFYGLLLERRVDLVPQTIPLVALISNLIQPLPAARWSSIPRSAETGRYLRSYLKTKSSIFLIITQVCYLRWNNLTIYSTLLYSRTIIKKAKDFLLLTLGKIKKTFFLKKIFT